MYYKFYTIFEKTRYHLFPKLSKCYYKITFKKKKMDIISISQILNVTYTS